VPPHLVDAAHGVEWGRGDPRARRAAERLFVIRHIRTAMAVNVGTAPSPLIGDGGWELICGDDLRTRGAGGARFDALSRGRDFCSGADWLVPWGQPVEFMERLLQEGFTMKQTLARLSRDCARGLVCGGAIAQTIVVAARRSPSG
jgi:hypothetical protein